MSGLWELEGRDEQDSVRRMFEVGLKHFLAPSPSLPIRA